MTGHELLAEVRRDHPDLAELPFVFLSALSDRASVIEGKRLGADDYLTKPVDFDLLLVTIEARLRQVERLRQRGDDKLVKLYTKLAGAAAEPPAVATTEAAAAAALADDVASLAERNDGVVTIGRLQIIGLAEVKTELGDDWPNLAGKVRALAEGLVREQLGPGDVFRIQDNDDFVLCFSSLSETEARFKAEVIREQLTERILGSRPLKSISQNRSKPFDLRRLTAMRSEARAVEVSRPELTGAADPIEVLLTKLESAAAGAEAKAEAIVEQLRQSCTVAPRQVCLANGTPTRLRILDFDARAREQVCQLRRMASSDHRKSAELDLLTLGRAVEHLYRTMHEDTDVLAVDISFDTLKANSSATQFFRTCAALKEAATGRLAFKISGFPVSAYSGIFMEKLRVLQRYSRVTILQIDEPLRGALDLRRLNIPLVALAYDLYRARMADDPARFQLFVKKIHDAGAKVILDEVPRAQLADLAARLPLDLVALARR